MLVTLRSLAIIPSESKDPNNGGFRAQILESEWCLGPKAPLFGSLDP